MGEKNRILKSQLIGNYIKSKWINVLVGRQRLSI